MWRPGASAVGAADHLCRSFLKNSETVDNLHPVLAANRATWHVHHVACRPGHPQELAVLPDGRWLISLPANPYAGLVAVRTLLDALAGRPTAPLPQAELARHGCSGRRRVRAAHAAGAAMSRAEAEDLVSAIITAPPRGTRAGA